MNVWTLSKDILCSPEVLHLETSNSNQMTKSVSESYSATAFPYNFHGAYKIVACLKLQRAKIPNL